MIHGHCFRFIDEPLLQGIHESCQEKIVTVEETFETDLLEKYPLIRPLPAEAAFGNWRPLSGRLAQFRSVKPFEEADEHFSWMLYVKDVLTLVWEPKRGSIYYKKGKEYTAERLRFWIYHTFFPITLEIQRKYTVLHVGAVEVNGSLILFTAPSFGGKSTLTNYFIAQGHTFFSDDSLCMEKRGKRFYVFPSFPFHRPYRELETLGNANDAQFARETKPISAIFHLEKVDADAPVSISPIIGMKKINIIYQIFFSFFSFRLKERFVLSSTLAKNIPLYQLNVPQDLKRLPEVYRDIVDYF